MKQKEIRDMKIGEHGYTYFWALFRVLGKGFFLNPEYPIDKEEFLNGRLLITRKRDGYHAMFTHLNDVEMFNVMKPTDDHPHRLWGTGAIPVLTVKTPSGEDFV